MTPQMQQAVKLLQMSNLDIQAYVERELTQNPLLERRDGGHNGTPGEFLSPDHHTTGSGNRFGGDFADLEDRVAGPVTIRQHLAEQIMVEIIGDDERLIAGYLVDCLDDAGYLSQSIEDIAEALDCPIERVEDVLAQVQQLDPAGLFARNLGECLALQLRERNRYGPAIAVVLDNLDLVARRAFTQLAGLSGVEVNEVVDMVDEIRTLDPKPASGFGLASVQPVRPDVLMHRHPSGDWDIELDPETLPRVLVNNIYHARLKRAAKSPEERTYIATQLQAAGWLVKALHQRAATVLRVSTEIVSRQEDFFLYGTGHLKPLALRDIAEAVDLHGSTVSRATANKLIATPRGIFALKYFFTRAIRNSAGGKVVSAEAVRQRVRELIDGEHPRKILSDDRIALILRTGGMDAARRTVAKYREALGLGSSVERRRAKSPPR